MTEGNEILHMEVLPEGWSHWAQVCHHSPGHAQTQAQSFPPELPEVQGHDGTVSRESLFQTLTIPLPLPAAVLLMIKLL